VAYYCIHINTLPGPILIKKVKLSLQQTVEVHRVVRRRGSHFLDTRLTDGVKVVSLTRLPAAVYSQEDSWYSFLLEAESTPGT
jgi:hypothetical protein